MSPCYMPDLWKGKEPSERMFLEDIKYSGKRLISSPGNVGYIQVRLTEASGWPCFRKLEKGINQMPAEKLASGVRCLRAGSGSPRYSGHTVDVGISLLWSMEKDAGGKQRGGRVWKHWAQMTRHFTFGLGHSPKVPDLWACLSNTKPSSRDHQLVQSFLSQRILVLGPILNLPVTKRTI